MRKQKKIVPGNNYSTLKQIGFALERPLLIFLFILSTTAESSAFSKFLSDFCMEIR